MDTAQAAAGYGGTVRAAADKKAITWNRKRLEDFGCFTPEGMVELRKGNAPAITKGPYTGGEVALDHVLPVAVVPELTARFYNLEAIPAKENGSKGAKIGRRELELARRWHRDGLLSAAGLAAVEAAGQARHE